MINQKFNALTVVRQSGIVRHGRNNVKVWLCKCDCGELLEVDQASLKKGQVPACKACRRGDCVICGAKITNPNFSVKRNTCSEACRKEQTRRRHRKRYAKLTHEDPNHNKSRHQQRLAKDGDYNKKRYQQFKKRLLTLSEEQRQIIIKKRTTYTTNWRAAWIEDKKVNDPGAYADFRKKARRSYIKHMKNKRLAQLTTTEIKGKSNE